MSVNTVTPSKAKEWGPIIDRLKKSHSRRFADPSFSAADTLNNRLAP